MNTESKVYHKYRNRKFIMCATGPSLTPEVVETIRKYKGDHVVFGINDAYRTIDFLDEHYACDEKWWECWGADFREKYPHLSSWAYGSNAAKWGVKVIKGFHNTGFSLRQDKVHYGSNSGYQALNIAFLMGGRKFILVGYNMQKIKGKSHFFGDHMQMSNNSPYNIFVQNYNSIQGPIRDLVVNCTENSALNCFRKSNLEEELQSD
jgi:hypothetical protein